jgi:hypothetical protein
MSADPYTSLLTPRDLFPPITRHFFLKSFLPIERIAIKASTMWSAEGHYFALGVGGNGKQAEASTQA